MKNVLLMALALFLCGSVQSQVVAKTYIFKPNRAGSFVVSDTVSHNLDFDLCKERADAWARSTQSLTYTGSILGTLANSMVKQSTITYADSVVTFVDNLRYRKAENYFAGTWTETLTYICKVKIEKDKVICTFQDMAIVYNYSGYGSSERKYSLDEKYFNYKSAIENLNKANSDSSLDKKEKKAMIKEANHEIEEDEISFGKIDKELSYFVKSFRERFK